MVKTFLIPNRTLFLRCVSIIFGCRAPGSGQMGQPGTTAIGWLANPMVEQRRTAWKSIKTRNGVMLHVMSPSPMSAKLLNKQSKIVVNIFI
jgi:hypothetical protein